MRDWVEGWTEEESNERDDLMGEAFLGQVEI